MSDTLIRGKFGQTWIRWGFAWSDTFERGHGWLYNGLIRRDAWKVGKLGFFFMRMPAPSDTPAVDTGRDMRTISGKDRSGEC